MTKDQIISAKILEAVARGLPIEQAFDEVMGEGAYIRMAGDLYDLLRSK